MSRMLCNSDTSKERDWVDSQRETDEEELDHSREWYARSEERHALALELAKQFGGI